jgi:aspartate kinase
MIVMKFGGSSVANRQQIEKVLSIVRRRATRATHEPLVVSSAHKGMTDALINGARDAARGIYAPEKVIQRQAEIARECGCNETLLAPFFDEIAALYRGLSLVRELSPRMLDYAASFGERMAVRVIADFFTRQGFPSQAFDAWELGFVTDANFGTARPLPGYEVNMVQQCDERIPKGVVPIVTGFVGQTETGDITTIGRNGSDLTATLIGAAIAAEEVEIWSDTDGVMTADPRFVPAARSIAAMHFDEAAELAYFGSRVLHPSTLIPAMEKNIPVRVLNTNRPEHPGTVIHHATPVRDQAATSIAYREHQFAVTISSARMLGAAGFLAEAFDALGKHDVVVDMIATSEVSVSFTTDRREPLEKALVDLTRLGSVRIEDEKTLLVVVGQGLATRVGIGAVILQAMADAGVNVEMTSFALKSISLTMLIADADVGRAVGVLHERLFERS